MFSEISIFRFDARARSTMTSTLIGLLSWEAPSTLSVRKDGEYAKRVKQWQFIWSLKTISSPQIRENGMYSHLIEKIAFELNT